MPIFESIEELAAVLREDDPPAPQILPGELEFERVYGTRGGFKVVSSVDRARFLYRGSRLGRVRKNADQPSQSE